MKGHALLDLMFASKEGWVGDMKVWDSIGCSDHEIVEFRILRGGSKTKSRIMALDFRSAEFVLFRDLRGRMTKLHSNAKCSMDVLLYLIYILNFYSDTLFFIMPVTYCRIILST